MVLSAAQAVAYVTSDAGGDEQDYTFSPDTDTTDPLYMGIDGQGTVQWNILDDKAAGTRTYWLKIEGGNYDIQLGEASIGQGSPGALAVFTTGSGWANPWGIGVVSNQNPYNVQDDTQHMSFYVGRPSYHVDPCIEYYLNRNHYEFNNKKHDAADTFDGSDHPLDGQVLGKTLYSANARRASQNVSLTFGFTLQGVVDANGNFLGVEFATPGEYVTPDGTTLTLDAIITDTNNTPTTCIFPNVGGAFALTNLRSHGVGTEGYYDPYGIPDDATTYIIITKNYDFSDSVPEPTTATLSLLALVGLAVRRRRK